MGGGVIACGCDCQATGGGGFVFPFFLRNLQIENSRIIVRPVRIRLLPLWVSVQRFSFSFCLVSSVQSPSSSLLSLGSSEYSQVLVGLVQT